MKVIDAIKSRRSIKAFDPEHQLSDPELRTLLSAAALTPTSFNMQNRHIVAVLNQATKTQLQTAAWGQEQVRDASAVLVLTGDLAAHRRTDRYLRNAPAPVRQQFEPMIADFYEGNDALLRDEACRSVGLSAMSLMLTAQELGYESCPIIGFDPTQVSDILGLDPDHVVIAALSGHHADVRASFGLPAERRAAFGSLFEVEGRGEDRKDGVL